MDSKSQFSTTLSQDHSILYLLTLLAALAAYHGVVRLGLGMDDYTSVEFYQNVPLSTMATWSVVNRFPAFSLAVLPFLLLLPLWLAHAIIIVVHTISGMLLINLLRWFGFSRLVSALAGIIFVIWPAHAEALLWISAAYVVFGVCSVLLGAVVLARKKWLSALLLFFLGTLFTEGLVLPALFLQLLILLRQHLRWSRVAAFPASHVSLYIAFQGVRKIISTGDGGLNRYPIGLKNLTRNASDLVSMSFGLSTSRDVAWMWNYATRRVDTVITLPGRFWLPALACGLVIAVMLYFIMRHGSEDIAKTGIHQVAVVLAGYVVALAIFLIITGNAMQTRYTYTSVAFLAVLMSISAHIFYSDRRIPNQVTGFLLITALVGWSFYRTWSNVWSNWVPAKAVCERIINDAQQAWDETHSEKIFLVNEPKVVGSAFALSRDWAYDSAGRLYIHPSLRLSADELVNKVRESQFQAGSSFSDKPCTFLSWKEGRPVTAKKAFDPNRNLILNCEDGLAEKPVADKLPDIQLRYRDQASQDFIRQFGLQPSTGPR